MGFDAFLVHISDPHAHCRHYERGGGLLKHTSPSTLAAHARLHLVPDLHWQEGTGVLAAGCLCMLLC